MEGGGNDKGLLMEYVKKSTPSPFLMKTNMMVEDPATDHVISWNADGTAFVVWQTADFARDLLPTLFKHSNFSSFVRQLNTYGFRKVASSRWEFSNERFRKGEKELLCEIRRRKACSTKQQQLNNAPRIQATPQESGEDQRSSSNTSSSSGYTSLVDENKRLKKENGVLSSELTVMKRKCKELLNLIAKHAQYPKKEDKQEEDDQRPMLFGVRLEVEGERDIKRQKRAEIAETATILLSQSCK
ncbi:hypothetical protein L6164_009376 [Bauhinia variegata]|uniref:Uncharacterized protein n=1 Tax=Bauhinia variegata TaxID=167791 RepID=A0ACB9PQ28_BAUVA|nr:hypothetical protein L6164_009376 [Bauhinia variegata]